jgi:16S rRNA (guanine527-N7)-methyltransferase
MVARWAPRLDLLAPGELERFHERHLLDSLKAVGLIDSLPPGPAVDVGSGAGLPGVPLALGCRERSWTLLEPRRGRAAFLEEVARELDLDVRVLALTGEQAAAAGERFAVATARALTPPTEAFELLKPLLVPHGVAVVWVGRTAELPEHAALWAPGLATIPDMGSVRKELE